MAPNLIAQSTNTPAATMRLKSIASALNQPGGEIADAIKSEAIPMAAGLVTGGSEAGVLAGIAHKTISAAFSKPDAARRVAFNAAIERAALDPEYGAQLVREYGRQAVRLSPGRALVRAAFASVPATVATKGVAQSAGRVRSSPDFIIRCCFPDSPMRESPSNRGAIFATLTSHG